MGSAWVGRRITCTDGNVKGADSATREFRRDGETIPGQTGETYLLTAADEGRRISCAVLSAGPDAFAVAESRTVIPGDERGRTDE